MTEFIGVWVIEKESGLPLASYEEIKSGIDSNMFGAFLVALRSMADDFKIGQLSSFTTDTANLLITSSEKLLSVLAIDKGFNVDSWYPILTRIHLMTETHYSSYIIDHQIIDSSDFEVLSNKYKKEVEKHQESLIINNQKVKKESEEREKAKKRLEDSGLW